jgi:hypothetical protein
MWDCTTAFVGIPRMLDFDDAAEELHFRKWYFHKNSAMVLPSPASKRGCVCPCWSAGSVVIWFCQLSFGTNHAARLGGC